MRRDEPAEIEREVGGGEHTQQTLSDAPSANPGQILPVASAAMDVELKKANTDQSIAVPVVDHEEEERLAKEAFVPSSGLTTAGP
jgi:hypothetical protein